VAKPRVEIHPDPAPRAAELLLEAAAGGGHVVLTGGSTPKAAYGLAAEARADWSRTELWFTDERCVAADHEHSNFRMANDALISKIEPRAVHRMQGERGPDDGADEYEKELAAVFGPGVVPQFDLILLGLGPDAHCASLFPNNPELGIRDRNVAGVEQPGMAPLVPRITLTLPALNAGARVVFLVAGEEKAEAVRRAFAGRPSPDAPSSLLEPRGDYVLVCDAAAASALPR
jgi:6-phosphogluconolactonase